MNDICRLLKSLKAKKDNLFAMATICRVDGSAYRREGAKMLICGDGSYYGTISAGCLEQDLIYQAEDVISTLVPKTVQYDLRSVDDLSWGQSAGCDGNIEVYVEPIGWNLNKLKEDLLLWPHIDEQLNKGFTVVSIKCLTPEAMHNPVILSFDHEMMDVKFNDIDIPPIFTPLVNQFLQERVKVKFIRLNELQADFLFELYEPKEQLFVFGAGPDAEPLVELASRTDFSVVVIDPRESRCNETYFPQADKRIVEHPATFFANRTIPENVYVLVMTHNFNRDREILQHLLQNPPKYIGVLGPKRRTERLINDKEALSHIYSPIGLDIFAEGPEEISISVVAQLIQIRNQTLKQQRIQRAVECWSH
ncbi:XdhC family protein [Neobacillus kokaensis]|uniref:Xanthine dehydrogenase subunit A n=1 Tax=Neobacillus kokaensis TaxID=2759023 RepID=A0ABQ3N2W6_9BACI|nr:XdhC family protein [Neobacillus kokaensis]GHH99254.1 putative xanthine dehydrogenase subunit A [Neobacillus kokaensis]